MIAFPRIETARLRLRPYRLDDIDELHRLWTDPAVRKYLFDNKVISKEWAESAIRSSIALFETHGFGEWVILPKEQDTLIGFCGFKFFFQPPELQLLYGLAPAYWGQGLTTEAAKAVIRYGFEEHGLERITASADVPNVASVRVMEKAGMTYEKRVLINGSDLVYYAISRPDFQPSETFYAVYHR